MNKMIAPLAAVLSFGMGIATIVPAVADATADARKAIETNFAKMTAALNKKDLKGYTQFYADDIIKVMKSGEQQNKQQAVAMMSRTIQQVKSVKIAISIQKFALIKGKAMAIVRDGGTVVIADPQTGKDTKIVGDTLKEFTWVRSGKDWKIKKIVETETKVTVDGKKIEDH